MTPAPSTCTPARDLLTLAIEHGWAAAWAPFTATNGAPYVTVRAVNRTEEIRVTWHTHTTGTYRLFSAIARTDGRNWHDITLTRAKQLVTTPEGGPS